MDQLVQPVRKLCVLEELGQNEPMSLCALGMYIREDGWMLVGWGGGWKARECWTGVGDSCSRVRPSDTYCVLFFMFAVPSSALPCCEVVESS